MPYLELCKLLKMLILANIIIKDMVYARSKDMLEAVNYYHKALHLGCCSSPRSASDNDYFCC